MKINRSYATPAVLSFVILALPFVSMLSKWGVGYVFVGLKTLSLATASIGLGIVIIAAVLVVRFSFPENSPRRSLAWMLCLVGLALALTGELIVYAGLAGCC
jgi:hypothetical protein